MIYNQQLNHFLPEKDHFMEIA